MARLRAGSRNWPLLSAVTALFVLVDLAIGLADHPTTGWAGPYAGVALQVLVDLSLLLLSRAPLLVAGLVVASTLALLGSDLLAPGLLAPHPSVSPAAVPRATPVIIIWFVPYQDRALAYSLVTVLAVLAARPWQPSWSINPFGLLSTLLPALGALYFGARHALVTSLRERAERAEREQHLLAERARFEERRRMTLEMHDVVSHRISLIVLQAGALTVSSAEETVRSAAEYIRATGAQAMRELRDVIGLMRDDAEGPPQLAKRPLADPYVPHPATLAKESASVGIPVAELDVRGRPGDASVSVARTAYRVVQEALTNVHKHAPGSRVSVRVHYASEAVQVRVVNTPATERPDPELATSGSGSGLRGLGHRVSMVGGTFSSGPTEDGGFAVEARLPGTAPVDDRPSEGGES